MYKITKGGSQAVRHSENYSCSNARALALAALATIAVLWLRWDGGDLVGFVNNSLWAEDGVVFINDAERYGLNSIWTQYAGYLHLYPRLIALIASQVDLIYTPWIFMSGFILAVWAMMFVVVRGMGELNLHPLGALAGAIILGVQPNNGDIFFTLTNSQWFLAVALCVLVSVPKLYSSSYFYLIGVALLSLTGPFSVLLLPVMLLRLFLDRNCIKSYAFPLIMTLCVAVQVFFIVSSGRGGEALSQNWREWLVFLFDSITFGGREASVIMLSVAFWALLLSSLLISSRKFPTEMKKHVIAALLLLAAGFCMYLGGVWGFKQGPGGLNPIWGNARYFFAPYAMIVLSLLVLSSLAPRTSLSAIFLFAIISFFQFRSVSRPDLQFPSFAAFAQVKAGLVIPIAPNPLEFPGWHIAPKRIEPENLTHEIQSFAGDEVEQFFDHEHSRLSFDIAEICRRSKHVGLAIKMWKREASDVRMNWGRRELSLNRFYPAGEVEMQFAFVNTDDLSQVTLDTGGSMQERDLYRIDVYCIGSER